MSEGNKRRPPVDRKIRLRHRWPSYGRVLRRFSTYLFYRAVKTIGATVYVGISTVVPAAAPLRARAGTQNPWRLR